jgi:hypothetical protein
MKFSIFLVKMSMCGGGTIQSAGRWYISKSSLYNETYEQILDLAKDTIYQFYVTDAYVEYQKHYADKPL